MGAIAGVIYPDPFKATRLLAPMLATLAHRGPDLETQENYRQIQIGSRGTSIKSNLKKEIYVAHDAQIHNIAELLKDLREAGYNIRDESIGSILANAYEKWGETFVERLDGDFAIAILDQRRSQLLLYRDRIGKKPLYWYHGARHFLFASELKALLATGHISQTPSEEALSTYLCLGYIPQDITPIADVNKLLPAYYLKIDLEGRKSIHSYWSCSRYFAKENQDSGLKLQNNLDQLLRSSTQRRTSEKDHVGCLVSGGTGPAAVAYYASQISSASAPNGFSASFQGETEGDLRSAQAITEALHLPHHTHQLAPETLMNDLVRAVWHLDEPLADPNFMATWHLGRLASDKKSDVILSGIGSEELLGGHLRYHLPPRQKTLYDHLSALPKPLLENVLSPLLQRIAPNFAIRLLRHRHTDFKAVHYVHHHALCREKEMPLLSPLLAPLFDPEVFLQKFYHMIQIKPTLSSEQYFDIKTILPDLDLLQHDRLFAAHGVKWETPFLDRHVVEYLAGISPAAKENPQHVTTPLQALLSPTIPHSVIDRPTKERLAFLSSWRTADPFKEIAVILQTGNLVESGLVDKKWLQHFSTTPSCPRSFRQFWAILVLEIWFRLFITSPIKQTPPKLWVKELLRSRT